MQADLERAILFLGPDVPLELIRAVRPTPQRGEILVRIECCTICSSDLHTQAGRRTEPTPTVLGHEIVGRIISFGEDAPRADARGIALNIGDRVTWTVAASCGRCINCIDGLDQKCISLVKYGHERVTREMPFRGGLADVVVLSPGTGIVKLPVDDPNAPLEVMTLANCSTATVAAALRTGFARRKKPGMSVVVMGAGVLGLTACAMARELYAASVVICCDRDEARAARALQFGATHTCTDLAQLPTVINAAVATAGVDVAVELAGSIHTTRAAVQCVRIGGTVILAGTTLPTDALSFEPQFLVRRLLRIEGVHNYVAADLITAVDFLLRAGTKYPMASLIAARLSLDEIDQAMHIGHDSPGQRVAILPGSTGVETTSRSAS